MNSRKLQEICYFFSPGPHLSFYTREYTSRFPNLVLLLRSQMGTWSHTVPCLCRTLDGGCRGRQKLEGNVVAHGTVKMGLALMCATPSICWQPKVAYLQLRGLARIVLAGIIILLATLFPTAKRREVFSLFQTLPLWENLNVEYISAPISFII